MNTASSNALATGKPKLFAPVAATQGETMEERERNVKEALAIYLESPAAHGDAVPIEGPSFQGRVTVPA